MIQLTEDNFEEEVLNASVPVLVDFWAPWCGPCRQMGPVIEELAKELEGRAKVCKLNVDDHGAVASRFGILSIPMFIVFKEGKPAEKLAGVVPKKRLLSLL